MPVQNAFSPAPVRTMHFTGSWRRNARQTVFNSRCISELNELCTSGRFSVIVATPSSDLFVPDGFEVRDLNGAHARRWASMPGFSLLKW